MNESDCGEKEARPSSHSLRYRTDRSKYIHRLLRQNLIFAEAES